MIDAKALARAIVAKKKPNGKAETSESDGDDRLTAAAGNILSASKSGDSSALASSLKEFISMCDD